MPKIRGADNFCRVFLCSFLFSSKTLLTIKKEGSGEIKKKRLLLCNKFSSFEFPGLTLLKKEILK